MDKLVSFTEFFRSVIECPEKRFKRTVSGDLPKNPCLLSKAHPKMIVWVIMDDNEWSPRILLPCLLTQVVHIGWQPALKRLGDQLGANDGKCTQLSEAADGAVTTDLAWEWGIRSVGSCSATECDKLFHKKNRSSKELQKFECLESHQSKKDTWQLARAKSKPKPGEADEVPAGSARTPNRNMDVMWRIFMKLYISTVCYKTVFLYVGLAVGPCYRQSNTKLQHNLGQSCETQPF